MQTHIAGITSIEGRVICFYLYLFCCCSVAKSCLTLATPWTAARHASLFSTISQRSLLRFMSIELVILSNHLILCCPLLLPSGFPSIGFYQHQFISYRLITASSQNNRVLKLEGNVKVLKSDPLHFYCILTFSPIRKSLLLEETPWFSNQLYSYVDLIRIGLTSVTL